VLDPAPPRRIDRERFNLLAGGDPAAIARAAAAHPLRREDLAARGLLFGAELERGLESLERVGEWFVTPEWLERERERIDERLAERAAAAPLDPGVPTGELAAGAWGPALLERLGVEQRGGKAYAAGAAPALGERAAEADALKARLAAAGPAGLRVEDAELASFLERAGELVRLGDGLAVSAAAYETARATALAQFEADGAIRLATFRDALEISRRPAQLLLERLDADGVTRRIGDERVVRRSAR
jgi:selenocysteine-specific elongation factor